MTNGVFRFAMCVTGDGFAAKGKRGGKSIFLSGRLVVVGTKRRGQKEKKGFSLTDRYVISRKGEEEEWESDPIWILSLPV